MYKEQSIALLNDLKSSNQYREFKEINRIAGKYP